MLGKSTFGRQERLKTSKLEQGPGAKKVTRSLDAKSKRALYSSHLRRTQDGCVGRVTKVTRQQLRFLTRWIDSLAVWEPLTDLAAESSNGMLLCRVMQQLVPGTEYTGLTPRPLSRTPAVNNIEQALAVIWQRSVNSRNMPSAVEVYEGKKERVASLYMEIWNLFGVKPVTSAKNMEAMFRFFNDVLSLYGRGLSNHTMGVGGPSEKMFVASVQKDFSDGVSLFCLLHYFCGHDGSAARNLPAVDEGSIFWDCLDTQHMVQNLTVVMDLMREARIPCIWTPNDLVHFLHHNSTFFLWQLRAVWRRLRDLPCALPEVPLDSTGESSQMGIASTSAGEEFVSGLRFRDHAGAARFLLSSTPGAAKDFATAAPSESSESSLGNVEHAGRSPPRLEPLSGGGGWNHSVVSDTQTRIERGHSILSKEMVEQHMQGRGGAGGGGGKSYAGRHRAKQGMRVDRYGRAGRTASIGTGAVSGAENPRGSPRPNRAPPRAPGGGGEGGDGVTRQPSMVHMDGSMLRGGGRQEKVWRDTKGRQEKGWNTHTQNPQTTSKRLQLGLQNFDSPEGSHLPHHTGSNKTTLAEKHHEQALRRIQEAELRAGVPPSQLTGAYTTTTTTMHPRQQQQQSSYTTLENHSHEQSRARTTATVNTTHATLTEVAAAYLASEGGGQGQGQGLGVDVRAVEAKLLGMGGRSPSGIDLLSAMQGRNLGRTQDLRPPPPPPSAAVGVADGSTGGSTGGRSSPPGSPKLGGAASPGRRGILQRSVSGDSAAGSPRPASMRGLMRSLRKLREEKVDLASDAGLEREAVVMMQLAPAGQIRRSLQREEMC